MSWRARLALIFARRRQRRVIRPVSGGPVKVALQNPPCLNQEDAGQLKAIADQFAHRMPIENEGLKAPPPNRWSHNLRELAAFETEGAVKFGFRVTHARHVAQTILREQSCARCFIAHMYERDLRSKRFQPLALGCDIRQGLAAKGSAQMPQEDQK
jgi:hypothetical protein